MPVFNWSCAGRAGAPGAGPQLEAAAGDRRRAGVPGHQLRAVRRPEPAAEVRARVLQVDGGADPGLRAVRAGAQHRGTPVRLRRAQRRRGADRPRAEPAVGELRASAPRTRSTCPTAPATCAGWSSTRVPGCTHLHIADCYNHRANMGNRYIVNPPGVDARVHQHNEIGDGDLDWDEFFGAVRDLNFDGIATVCVFGWEEDADDDPPPDAGAGNERTGVHIGLNVRPAVRDRPPGVLSGSPAPASVRPPPGSRSRSPRRPA